MTPEQELAKAQALLAQQRAHPEQQQLLAHQEQQRVLAEQAHQQLLAQQAANPHAVGATLPDDAYGESAANIKRTKDPPDNTEEHMDLTSGEDAGALQPGA